MRTLCSLAVLGAVAALIGTACGDASTPSSGYYRQGQGSSGDTTDPGQSSGNNTASSSGSTSGSNASGSSGQTTSSSSGGTQVKGSFDVLLDKATATGDMTTTFTVQVTIAPKDGFAGKVDLKCAGLPTHATGTFDKTSVDVSCGDSVLAAGEYSVFFTIDEDMNWSINFQGKDKTFTEKLTLRLLPLGPCRERAKTDISPLQPFAQRRDLQPGQQHPPRVVRNSRLPTAIATHGNVSDFGSRRSKGTDGLSLSCSTRSRATSPRRRPSEAKANSRMARARVSARRSDRRVASSRSSASRVTARLLLRYRGRERGAEARRAGSSRFRIGHECAQGDVVHWALLSETVGSVGPAQQDAGVAIGQTHALLLQA